ncbi:TetR/AcrR family transcriptional regulator [Spiribacter halobius]|uniref:TetR family transcriptional regulator n=1 Tax=Sediminicurvatus halobius TaxID=2182432 RepID=A0A2U2N3D8_9GAMM|nr:TetR/AcrR family transcriptional regulator [Spiribacter halobius]PWG63741.1 TetR family transcriptional regulator [Spiribacter halobius]UEX76222.1 TetR/AcrR family transcriptional regulator; helix-turn-helix transcriptional regulator [Spiribacter halobius]
MSDTQRSVQERDPAGQRRRLPGERRRALIVEAAAERFAAQGFGLSTRELARGMGVTQALLYRYFPSKEALVEAVFEAVFVDRWRPEWSERLGEHKEPLENRLTRFYESFLASRTAVSMRLFMRGALDGQAFPERYTRALDERILRPVVDALRQDAGLPELAREPLLNGERELAMVLHGGIVFLAIRKHIYGTPLPDDCAEHVLLQVRTFLGGAPQVLQSLHSPESPQILRMPVLRAPDAITRP